MLTARSGSGLGLRIPGLIVGLALVTALTAILIGWRAQSWVGDGPDPYWFSAMGRSVARGEGLAAYGNLLHRRAPLYPLMIAAIYTAFGEHQILVKLVQALLFATMSVLAYDIGRRIYGPRTGLLAGMLCAIHPALLRYAADLHLETLFTFAAHRERLAQCSFLSAPAPQGRHRLRRRGCVGGAYESRSCPVRPAVHAVLVAETQAFLANARGPHAPARWSWRCWPV